MGFEVPQTTLRLVFTDPSYSGLEVVCAVVPIGQVQEAAKLADVDPKNVTDEDMARVERIIGAFADALVSWNLTRKGRKVPATRRSVESLDLIFVMQLIAAWLMGLGELVAAQAQEDAELAKSIQVDALG
jgi:hypothetical protein